MRITMSLSSATRLALALALSSTVVTGRALAAGPPGAGSEVAGTPQTAEEHLARAAEYDQKAKSAREEAQSHRKMFADFEKQELPTLKSNLGMEPPWVATIRDGIVIEM